MTSRICKFGCETVLEGWDDNAKKFIEAGTGGLHTKERCQEAKLKLEQKNNHGKENELVLRPESEIEADKRPYVDHTKQPRLKIKTFTDPTPEGLDLKVNTFGDIHNIKHGQYRMSGSLYSTQVWYEEIKQ